jgi:hypothetical protein
MSHSLILKQKAKKLRKKGYSFHEISIKINIPKATVYSWVNLVDLSDSAKKRLVELKLSGAQKGAKKSKYRMLKMKKEMDQKSQFDLENIHFSQQLLKVLCSFLYWGEGNKSGSYVAFINSDPEMIRVFMILLRQSFELDEAKFRVLVHIHEYHHEKNILKFWSEVTSIPLSQFTKSYLKSNTKIRRRPGYMGSARIRYYDVKIVRELQALYNAVALKIRAVG